MKRSVSGEVEAASKPWIMSESKASRGLKAERTRQYVSISSHGMVRTALIKARVQGAQMPCCEAYHVVRRSNHGMQRNAEIGLSAKPSSAFIEATEMADHAPLLEAHHLAAFRALFP
jgi:hypothetical protein